MKGRLWLACVALSACVASESGNPAARCDQSSECLSDQICYRGFCVEDGAEQADPVTAEDAATPVVDAASAHDASVDAGAATVDAAVAKDADAKDADVKDAAVNDAGADAAAKDTKDAAVKGGAAKDAAVKDAATKDAAVQDTGTTCGPHDPFCISLCIDKGNGPGCMPIPGPICVGLNCGGGKP